MQTIPACVTSTYTTSLAGIILRQVNPELGDEVDRHCERITLSIDKSIDTLLALATARPRPQLALPN